MPERRRIHRKYLMYYTRVYDAATREVLGNLVDVTPAGAMLISEAPIPVNQDYHLKLELSPDVADRPYLELDARSVWCRPDIDPHFYNAGFELRGVTPEDLLVIEHIVEAYGFRDN